MELEINYAKKMKKPTNTWRLNNMLLNNQWTNDQIKTEIKQYMETNENNNTKPQLLWEAAKAVLGGKYIAIQEGGTIPYEQSKLAINETRKGRTNEAQNQ